MSRRLLREEPYKEVFEYPWDESAIRRFSIGPSEKRWLEDGHVLWRGSTAFTLEDVKEAEGHGEEHSDQD